MDLTHIYCGADGWGHLTAVIDRHAREVPGYELLRGRAEEAERALEEACLKRFGTLRPEGFTPVLRRDNGLVFLRIRADAAIIDCARSSSLPGTEWPGRASSAVSKKNACGNRTSATSPRRARDRALDRMV